MATVNSNVVTPQQAALTAKASTNPLQSLLSSTFPKANTVAPASTAAVLPQQTQPNALDVANKQYAAQFFPAPPAPAPQSFGAFTGLAPATSQQNTAGQSGNVQSPAPTGTTTAAVPANTFTTQTPQQQANVNAALSGAGTGSGLISLPNTFGSATGALLNTSLNGSAQANSAINQLQGSVNNNTAIGQQAQNIANSYGQQIANVGQQGAMAQAGYKSTGTTPVGEGNAAIVNQSTAAQQTALATGEQAALQGVGYQLTGQNQLQSGLNQAGSLGQAGQGLVQSGLNQAGGLLSPVQVPYSNQYIDPVTGQPVSGTATSPFNGGAAVGNYAAGQDYAQMKIADTAAKGIQGSITSYLSQNPQLNPSDATFANSIAQWASGQQLGDPKYQTLSNYLNEYISTLAPILGVGGDTTNLKTQIAQSMINGTASGQSISEVLGNISQLADNKLANIASAGNGGGVVAGGGSGGTTFGSFFGN